MNIPESSRPTAACIGTDSVSLCQSPRKPVSGTATAHSVLSIRPSMAGGDDNQAHVASLRPMYGAPIRFSPRKLARFSGPDARDLKMRSSSGMVRRSPILPTSSSALSLP